MTITSAYNFAPLARQVVCPEWAQQVSHDLPFEDGVCAEIDIRLTAHTPLLVGDSKGSGPAQFYRHPDGRHAIPGSSLRGMLRNVLEVASFARMVLIEDKRLSVRDLDLPAYRLNFTTPREPYATKTRGGWLRFDAATGGWSIEEHEVARIEQSQLMRVLSKQAGMSVHEQLVHMHRKASKDEQRLAGLKYRAMDSRVRLPLRDAAQPGPHTHSCGLLEYRKVELAPSPPPLAGYLVLTGQPGPLDADRAQHTRGTKHLEFVFLDHPNPKNWPVSAEVIGKFREAYAHSPDLAFLESAESPHRTRGVPVFFLATPDNVTSLGLSQIYRLPAPRSLGEIARAHQAPRQARQLDFVETLFGVVEGDEALRGRVSVGDLRCEQPDPAPADGRFLKPTVLGSPKPSFHPAYLVQTPISGMPANRNNEFKSYLDTDASLRGWKRYPVRPLTQVALGAAQPGNAGVNVSLAPLKEGARFTGRIRLHNVRPQEIGAVLWALTWGGRPELRHALGMGKSFGFGQVSIDVTALAIRPNLDGKHHEMPTLLKEAFAAWTKNYVEYMSEQVTGWLAQETMVELLAMADPGRPQATQQHLRPLRLDLNGHSNEFRTAKARVNRWRLPRYTKIANVG